MGWNTNDGQTEYRTSDGRIFGTEKEAYEHEASKKYNAELEALAERLKYEAGELVNKGKYQEAITHIQKNWKGDSRIPQHCWAIVGLASELLGDYEDAINFYTSSCNKYDDCYFERARVYTIVKEWKLAKSDCHRVINREHSFNDQEEKLKYVFYYRGLCFENLGNKKRAIEDYKLASDFGNISGGNKDSLEKLKSFNITYYPKPPPKTFRGNVLLAIITGLFSLVTGLSIVLLHFNGRIRGFWPLLAVAALILTIILWRNIRSIIYPIVKKAAFLVLLTAAIISTNLAINWVIDSFAFAFEKGATATVTATTDGRLHKEPSVDSEYIKQLPEGTQVIIVGELVRIKSDWWIEVEHNGDRGFIDTSYIRRNE